MGKSEAAQGDTRRRSSRSALSGVSAAVAATATKAAVSHHVGALAQAAGKGIPAGPVERSHSGERIPLLWRTVRTEAVLIKEPKYVVALRNVTIRLRDWRERESRYEGGKS